MNILDNESGLTVANMGLSYSVKIQLVLKQSLKGNIMESLGARKVAIEVFQLSRFDQRLDYEVRVGKQRCAVILLDGDIWHLTPWRIGHRACLCAVGKFSKTKASFELRDEW